MEALVILDHEKMTAESRAAVSNLRRSHEFSDRAFVVDGSAPAVDRLRSLPGITATQGSLPSVVVDLSRAEQLSIDAWSRRGDMQAKVRPGDGRSWGDENFEAPR